MATDTKGLSRELEGKVVRIYFQNGEIAEVKLVSFDLHKNCPFGDEYAGIIYDVIKTNRPEIYKVDPATCGFWAEFQNIEKFELIDSQQTTDH